MRMGSGVAALLSVSLAWGCGQEPPPITPLESTEDSEPQAAPPTATAPTPLAPAEALPPAEVAVPAKPPPPRMADDSAEIAQLRRRVAALEKELRKLRSEVRSLENATTPDVASLRQLSLEELQGRFALHRAKGGNKDLARALAVAISQNHPATEEGLRALVYLAYTVSRNDAKGQERYLHEILRYHPGTPAAMNARRYLAYAAKDDLEAAFRWLEPIAGQPGTPYPNVGTAKWLRRQVRGTNQSDRGAAYLARLAAALPKTQKVNGVELPSSYVAQVQLERAFILHNAGKRTDAAAAYAQIAAHLNNPQATGRGRSSLRRTAQTAKEWLAKLEAGEAGPEK